MAVRHIVFDIGNVLLDFDPEYVYLELIPDPVERNAFLGEVCSRDWIVAQDRVQEWAPGEAALIARYPAKEALIRSFRERWHDMVPDAIAKSVEILHRLSADGADLTALTNFNGETFDEAYDRFELFKHFRGITVSGKIGLLKPAPEIFRHHAATCGLVPEDVLFIDDVPENVQASRAAGWQALQFTTPDELWRDLQLLKVIV